MRSSPLTVWPLLITALVASAADQSAQTNWTTRNFATFSFQAPRDMTNVPVRAFDSIVGSCASGDISLTFDYGWYGGRSLKEHLGQWNGNPRSKLRETNIDGQAAEIASYQLPAHDHTGSDGRTNVICVRFSKVGNGKPSASLDMTAYCLSEADQATAQRICESIRFKKN